MAKEYSVVMGFRGASYDGPAVLKIGPPINQLRNEDRREVESRSLYEQDAETLVKMLCMEIPSGTLDALMVKLLAHRASTMPDSVYHEMARGLGQRIPG